MFDIEKRACRIGTSINTRSEKHGEVDVVSALDIPLKKIVLDSDEAATLLEEPDAELRLFKPDENGTLVPAFPKVKRFPIDDDIESARVELDLGAGKVLVLAECKLKRLKVERLRGATYALSLQVQCAPKMTDPNVGRLLDHLDCDVLVTIHEQNEQTELELPEGKREVSGGFKPTRTGKQLDAETRANGKAKRKAAKERAKAETRGNVTPIHGRFPEEQQRETEQPPTNEPPPSVQ